MKLSRFHPIFIFLAIISMFSVSASAPRQTSMVVFAVIGDYGTGSQAEADVANLVKSWNPNFIVTVGDNNYPDGAAYSLDPHIGQYYHDYIYKYKGRFGGGSATMRFFPALGNHDWHNGSVNAYTNYFSLPGNERFYDFIYGSAHFFILDSMKEEEAGNSANSTQAKWLQNGLANSTSQFNVVVTHYPPYSSGKHGSVPFMQWQFKEWGADVVLSGHNHIYERLSINGLTYIVNGLGGDDLGGFRPEILPGSAIRYNGDYGALRMEATDTTLKFQFVTRGNIVIDEYTLGESAPSAVSLISANPKLSNASALDFNLAFSEPVTGVDVSDFIITANGVSGAYISNISGYDANYVVTVNTGAGSGDLRLDLINNGSIANIRGTKLNAGISSETFFLDRTPPAVIAITRAQPSPSNAATVDYAVTFSETVWNVDISDFILNANNINGAYIANVSGGGSAFIVSVNTGSGSGELRLDLANNYSIADVTNNALINSFTGESYVMEKSAPTVLSITRANAELSNAPSVDFNVVFSEPVTGVDSSDFIVSTTNGAFISGVNGAGANYLVSVNTSAGDGALRLDLLDNDSILNAAGVPLGANFTSGEAYAIDKTPPAVVSILRAGANPSSAASVDYIVNFSEAVFGVDAADFILNTTNGAFISGVNGGGAAYIVTITTGAGADSLRLDTTSGASIFDMANNPDSGNFTAGEIYTINKLPPSSTDVIPPATPTLLSPAHGATLSARYIFTWTRINDATRYEIQIDNNADFSSLEWDSWRRDPEYQLSFMPKKTAYYWRVRAKDMADNWSAWSEVFMLNVP